MVNYIPLIILLICVANGAYHVVKDKEYRHFYGCIITFFGATALALINCFVAILLCGAFYGAFIIALS